MGEEVEMRLRMRAKLQLEFPTWAPQLNVPLGHRSDMFSI